MSKREHVILDDEKLAYSFDDKVLRGEELIEGKIKGKKAHIILSNTFIVTTKDGEETNVEFKNIRFELSKTFYEDNKENNFDSVFVIGTNEKECAHITFTDCDFEGFNDKRVDLCNVGRNGYLNYKNCIFTDMHSLVADSSYNGNLSFENCDATVKEGSLTQLTEDATAYFKNCTFSSDFVAPTNMNSGKFLDQNKEPNKIFPYWGICLGENAQISMEGVKLNGFYVGLFLTDTAYAVCKNCCFDSSFNNAWLQKKSKTRFNSCLFTNSYDSSLHVLENSQTKIDSCSFNDNKGSGLYLNCEIKADIKNSEFCGNDCNGLDIWEGEADITVTNCRIECNKLAGIGTCNSGEVKVIDSTLSNNRFQNFVVINKGRAFFNKCDFIFNKNEKYPHTANHCFVTGKTRAQFDYCSFYSEDDEDVGFLLGGEAKVELYSPKMNHLYQIANLDEQSYLYVSKPEVKNMDDLRTEQSEESWVKIVDANGKLL